MTPGCRLFPNSRDSGARKTGERRGNGTFWLDKVRALRQLKPVGVYGRCRGGESAGLVRRKDWSPLQRATTGLEGSTAHLFRRGGMGRFRGSGKAGPG